MSIILSSTTFISIKEGRGSHRTDMKFVAHSEEDFETKRRMDNLKADLMKEYKDVFKKKLTPSDRIKAPPIRVEVNKEAKVKPVNCMTLVDVPAQLRHAAEKELKDALEAGFLEPCHHATKWCSRSFFVEKQGSEPTKV